MDEYRSNLGGVDKMEKTKSDNQPGDERINQDVTLVFMAAGMGKRFGGNKQLAEIGPKGQSLMAYTAYDAVKIGYKRLIFILQKGMEEEFMKTLGHGLKKVIPMEIVFQDNRKRPEGTRLPEGREKPLGTGHALYCAKDRLEGPFVILNADDLYGRGVLQDLFQELERGESMVIPGYPVAGTLSDKGAVSRGILEVDHEGYVKSIKEKEKIWKEKDKIYTLHDECQVELEADTRVSMNIWGMKKEVLEDLDDVFTKFLEGEGRNLSKDEFYLPEAMDELRKRSGGKLKIIEANDRWMGMTYKEDQEEVTSSIKELINCGHYPESLFGE